MNDIHFSGLITRYKHTVIDDHSPQVVHAWVLIEPTNEVMVEESGTPAELALRFELGLLDNKLDFENFTGRKCDVIYNAQGYHFVSFIQ